MDLVRILRQWLISAVYGVIVVVDILLTVSLIVVLLQSKTGFKR